MLELVFVGCHCLAVYPGGFSSPARTRSICSATSDSNRCSRRDSGRRSGPGDVCTSRDGPLVDFGPGELDLAVASRVHSPYEGPRSLSPQAQDATSRVLTLFTGVRFTNTTELICDVQETGGHGIGEAVGLAGVTNLDIVRNPGLSKSALRRSTDVHHIISLAQKKIDSSRSPLSLFSSLPERRLEIRFGKFSMADFSIRILTARTPLF